ncbi:putative lignostilbene dioxygenase [Xylariaceae sp. FL0016]|nr:putative lignostilbene dioxygenase [Xylariaceae sp. FL0016]
MVSTPPPKKHFPAKPQFEGFMKPSRVEGDIAHLEVQGSLPNDLNGTFYRVMPDPQLPPFIEDDPWFNGDGNVSAFHIENGSASFRQRYVRTEKFTREREAKRALIGKYRNKFTDAVEFKVRSTANTNVVYFNKQLLALKEDSPPYAMDPVTLETRGLYDFDGQLPSLTFTAHPKFDPESGEMIGFGYEAKGDGTPDVCYYTVSADGKFTQTLWLVAPVVAMIHDFAVTKNWVLFPLIPQLCDLERLKKGGEHWQWSPNTPFYLGVIPRYGGKSSDVKWFRFRNSFPGHSVNAYEDDSGNINFELGLGDENSFFWWPDEHGNAPEPSSIVTKLVRFTVDPRTDNLDLAEPEILSHDNCEFFRINDRFMGHKHQHVYGDVMIPSLGTNFPVIGPQLGGGAPLYNALFHYSHVTGKSEVYFPGPTHMVQEPVFVPRNKNSEEGDGYILVLVNNYVSMSSELHVIDSKDFTKPAAVILLPVRLRAGLHGNWVDREDMV